MKYKLIIAGYGCQINIGTIPEHFYEYWTTVGDPNELDSRLFPAFDKNGIKDENYTENLDSDDPKDIGMWRHHNDTCSVCNAFIDYFHCKVFDEQDNLVWSTDTIEPVYVREINDDELGSGCFLRTRFDKKGTFVDITLDTEEFNPKKLKLHTKLVEGIEVIDRVLYEGKMRKTQDHSQRHPNEDNRQYKFIKNT